MNRCFLFLKQRFNLFYCYLFRRHSINGGNVIVVETLFRFFDAARFSGAGSETTSVSESGEKAGQMRQTPPFLPVFPMNVKAIRHRHRLPAARDL
ncbi:hypothetical protein EHJ10_13320 [Cronobacter dublinensis]|nr:hypothetical protein [Cronobacter dublinensis]